jgi:hypothetical protein
MELLALFDDIEELLHHFEELKITHAVVTARFDPVVVLLQHLAG